MRILIATDAWKPQVNGVVGTYEHLRHELEAAGHEVTILSPLDFATLPCPGYGEIRLALPRRSIISAHLIKGGYDHIHIATEGPIGWVTRSICLRRAIRFTTSYHTRFPEYLKANIGVPAWLGYAAQRRFHGPALATLVATPSLKDDLQRRGFNHLKLWPRGVDTAHFRPLADSDKAGREPVFLYVGAGLAREERRSVPRSRTAGKEERRRRWAPARHAAPAISRCAIQRNEDRQKSSARVCHGRRFRLSESDGLRSVLFFSRPWHRAFRSPHFR